MKRKRNTKDTNQNYKHRWLHIARSQTHKHISHYFHKQYFPCMFCLDYCKAGSMSLFGHLEIISVHMRHINHSELASFNQYVNCLTNTGLNINCNKPFHKKDQKHVRDFYRNEIVLKR